jgi:hypothetical protein
LGLKKKIWDCWRNTEAVWDSWRIWTSPQQRIQDLKCKRFLFRLFLLSRQKKLQPPLGDWSDQEAAYEKIPRITIKEEESKLPTKNEKGKIIKADKGGVSLSLSLINSSQNEGYHGRKGAGKQTQSDCRV